MIADLKPYPEYKESGAPWLGRVPAHWEVRRIKAILREVDRRSTTGSEPLLSLRMHAGLVNHHDSGGKLIPPSALVGYKHVLPGEIVMNRMRAAIGLFAAVTTDGLVSPDYAVFRPTCELSTAYFVHLFRTPAMTSVFRLESRGLGTGESGFLRLYSDRFGILSVPVPPPGEQRAILRFLDWANGRLERAVRAKRKIIALLNEQKQAIIHHAVTRGLDPAVPLKPSGIPWLGDIPSHWEVRPLKAVGTIQSGVTLGKDYTGQATHPYPYLRVANVQAGHVSLEVVKTVRVPKVEALRCTLQEGDVLMTEGGDPDKLGRGCVWDAQLTPCLHQNHVFAVRPNRLNLEPRFLSALMGTRYARAYFESTAKQTTNLASTNKTKIGQFSVLLPSVKEQRNILAAIAEETRPATAAMSRLEREIELLRECRTRLVADVVTGKLDVREATAHLPEEAVPDSAEDDTDLSADPEAIEEEAAV